MSPHPQENVLPRVGVSRVWVGPFGRSSSSADRCLFVMLLSTRRVIPKTLMTPEVRLVCLPALVSSLHYRSILALHVTHTCLLVARSPNLILLLRTTSNKNTSEKNHQ